MSKLTGLIGFPSHPANSCDHEWESFSSKLSEQIIGQPLSEELPVATKCRKCGMLRFSVPENEPNLDNGYYIVTEIKSNNE